MKKIVLLFIALAFLCFGCAGAGKMTKPSDIVAVSKKFDLGEFHFKWIIMFPLEVFVGTITRALFMTPEQVEQMTLGMGRLEKAKKEKKSHDLRDWWQK